jgi:thymidylate kinase
MSKEKVNQLEQEELDSLKSIQVKYNQVMSAVGHCRIQVLDLQNREDELLKQIEELKADEIKLMNDLQEKYGGGILDINEGTITTRED